LISIVVIFNLYLLCLQENTQRKEHEAKMEARRVQKEAGLQKNKEGKI